MKISPFLVVWCLLQESVIAQVELPVNNENLHIYVQDENLMKILSEKENNCKSNIHKTIDKRKSNALESANQTKPSDLKYGKSGKNFSTASNVNDDIDSRRKLNVKDICKDRENIDGFKIKILTTKSADEARNTLLELIKLYPSMTTPEILSLRPDYHVIVGDYFTKNAASKDLNILKQKYPNAVITPARVFCRRAILNGF